MNARDARLLELMLELRDPLSRIELALAEGLPSAGMPARFVEGVRGAVAEADARLEAVLRALRAESSPAPADEDCRGTLDAVAERVRGPLAARGLSLELRGAPAPVPGNAAQLRRAMLCLLRVGCTLAGAEGRLHLALCAEAERHGLELRVEGADATRVDEPARAALQRFAAASGGESSLSPLGPDAVSLALWLPGGGRS